MGYPSTDQSRKELVDVLLRRAHEQSSNGAERQPFWREGSWRCEFYKSAGTDRLKLFSGARCVHEEIVKDAAGATERAQELRRAVRQGEAFAR